MRRKAFTWWQAALVLGGMALIAAVLLPVFGRMSEHVHPPSCQSNLKQIGLGFKQYVQDYDGRYPLMKSGNAGWTETLQPYLKSTQIFHCYADRTGRVDGTTDYFYNARLSGIEERRLNSISSTILMGEGVPDSPPNTSLGQLPPLWASDATSPANRHEMGANYAYADGHVKWLRPTSVTSKPAAPNISTFAP